MALNSLEFIIFLAVFYPVFLIIKDRFRSVWLLAASWFFYFSFKPEYLLLLVFLTAADFWLGNLVAGSSSSRTKKIFLLLGILCNVGVLFVFKYLGFFSGLAAELLAVGNPLRLSLVLPVGISFHTFQGMAYLVDIFRKKIAPEKSFLTFALFISIFPQLLAGPIERASHLIPQLKARFNFKNVNLRAALLLIVVGYFKKMVIADNLAVVVDRVYNAPHDFSGAVLLVATVFFGFQLYCDFSGYIDIARGIGKLLGIDFVKNFDKPYFSRNITEFWRRWHISLSDWVRDYIYIPLGGNRKGVPRQYANLILTMSIMGLWHGAGLNFVAWGVYHGILLVLHKLYLNFKFVFLPGIFGIFVTYAAVNIGWIFFRSRSLSDAVYILDKICSSILSRNVFPLQSNEFYFSAFLVVLLLVFELADTKFNFARNFSEKSHPAIFGIFFALAVQLILLFGVHDPVAFIYSQF